MYYYTCMKQKKCHSKNSLFLYILFVQKPAGQEFSFQKCLQAKEYGRDNGAESVLFLVSESFIPVGLHTQTCLFFFLNPETCWEKQSFYQLSLGLRMKIFLLWNIQSCENPKNQGAKILFPRVHGKKTQTVNIYELCEEKSCPPNLPHYFHLLLPIVTSLLLSNSLWECIVQNMFQTPQIRSYHLRMMHLKFSFPK